MLTAPGRALHDALTATDPIPPLKALGRDRRFVEDLPELADLQLMGTGQGRWRHKDTWTHSVVVAGKAPADRVALRYAALLHDIGKPATRRLQPDGTVTFHSHEAVGGRLTRRMLTRLGHPADFTDHVADVVTMSGRFKDDADSSGTPGVWSDSAVRRFVRDAGGRLEDLLALAEIDVTSKYQANHDRVATAVAALRTRIAQVGEADARAAERPDVDGHTLMAELAVPPGPLLGEVLAHLLALKRSRGPLGRDVALKEAAAFLTSRK